MAGDEENCNFEFNLFFKEAFHFKYELEIKNLVR